MACRSLRYNSTYRLFSRNIRVRGERWKPECRCPHKTCQRGVSIFRRGVTQKNAAKTEGRKNTKKEQKGYKAKKNILLDMRNERFQQMEFLSDSFRNEERMRHTDTCSTARYSYWCYWQFPKTGAQMRAKLTWNLATEGWQLYCSADDCSHRNPNHHALFSCEACHWWERATMPLLSSCQLIQLGWSPGPPRKTKFQFKQL